LSSQSDRHRPQKKWGQNFLRNPGAVRKIVDAVDPRPDELILEIGPGEGVLTRELVQLPNRVRVVEIDPNLAAALRDSGLPVEVLEGDATEVALPDRAFVAVGNLPYNVANPIMRRIVADRFFRRGVFMVQKEVADRLAARPGTDPYGFLTIAIGVYATARSLFTLGPGSFFPPPKVRSSVVELVRADPGLSVDRDLLLGVASAAFAMRRKKLRNNLVAAGVDKAAVDELLRESKIGEDIRAERMSIADFDRLAAAIERAGVANLFRRLEPPPSE
jgi:16S rRNA (adenine1518-N6/adenine1519-N6)-dimethyltransferase